MKMPSEKEQKQLVKQWEETGRELRRLRLEALRDMPYNWRDVDALLELGDLSGCPSRTTSGLVEWQRWMKILRERDGSPGDR